jgi:hypothetical protein
MKEQQAAMDQFHTALINNDVNEMATAIKQGYKINAVMPKSGETHLDCVVQFGTADALRFLLANGYELARPKNNGDSQLHSATKIMLQAAIVANSAKNAPAARERLVKLMRVLLGYYGVSKLAVEVGSIKQAVAYPNPKLFKPFERILGEAVQASAVTL